MVDIKLSNKSGFKWHNNDFLYVKGYLFSKEGVYYSDRKLLDYFTSDDLNSLEKKVSEANGSFSFVLKTEFHVIFGVDRLRSLPLFYSQDGKSLVVYDSPSMSFNMGEKQFVKVSLQEFYLAGYTSNDSTLISSLKQVEAGTFLIYNRTNRELTKKVYYKHLHHYDNSIDADQIMTRMSRISDNIFSRLIDSCNHRYIILPLSGGYDSRYIATYLKEKGYRNVICYTYGKSDSFEVQTSKKVANALGFEWYFVQYDKSVWKKVLDSDFLDFAKFSFNYSSLPHIQDYFAVSFLLKEQAIPSDGIVVPGFCGDLLGGSFLLTDLEIDRFGISRESMINYIYFKHFNLIRDKPKYIDQKGPILKSIEKSVEEKIFTLDDFVSFNEHWFTLHKVSKYILNSLRTYEYFDLEWRLPLWDNELIDFWYKVPNKYRKDSKQYNEFLFLKFRENNIDFRKPYYYKNSSLKRIYKKLFNQLTLINYIMQGSSDVNGFGELYKILKKDIKYHRTESIYKNTFINHVLSQWIIEKVSNKN